MVLKKEFKNKGKSTKESKKAASPQKEKIVSLKYVRPAKKTKKTIVSKAKHKLPVKFKNEIIYSVSLNPIFVFILTMSVWDILFSPFGANRIILLPLYLVFLLKHKNLKKIN